jgi:hypothetical protein
VSYIRVSNDSDKAAADVGVRVCAARRVQVQIVSVG